MKITKELTGEVTFRKIIQLIEYVSLQDGAPIPITIRFPTAARIDLGIFGNKFLGIDVEWPRFEQERIEIDFLHTKPYDPDKVVPIEQIQMGI